MNLDGFPWPTIGQRKTIAPAWDGSQFIVDLEPFEILTYSESRKRVEPGIDCAARERSQYISPDRCRLTKNGNRIDETAPEPQESNYPGRRLLQRFSRGGSSQRSPASCHHRSRLPPKRGVERCSTSPKRALFCNLICEIARSPVNVLME